MIAVVFAYLSVLPLHAAHHLLEPGPPHTYCAVAFGAQHTPHPPIDPILIAPPVGVGTTDCAARSVRGKSAFLSQPVVRGPPVR